MRTLDSQTGVGSSPIGHRATLGGHLKIARVDHWVKNVFVLPGIVVAISVDRSTLTAALARHVPIGLLSVCLVTSCDYVLNELLDAPFDREYPLKRSRPVPSGQMSVPLAFLEWILLMIAGIGMSLIVSIPFALPMLALWVMGCVYNISPIRSKDLPYLISDHARSTAYRKSFAFYNEQRLLGCFAI